MKLILQNGYPYPLPPDFDSDQYDARSHHIEIDGVIHFEWKHTLTVEFETDIRASRVHLHSEWEVWNHNTLEARISVADGYNHPAIIYGDKAYCGFILVPEAIPDRADPLLEDLAANVVKNWGRGDLASSVRALGSRLHDLAAGGTRDLCVHNDCETSAVPDDERFANGRFSSGS